MKLCLVALLAGFTSGFAAQASAAVGPVSRVTAILQSLQQKCEEELEKEKSAFQKFKCWAETIISTKTASNEQAQARKESLEQYVADIEAGKIEFTTERVDLEKEIASLTADLERAEAMREQEHEDYLAAKAETEQAITALGDAIAVLEGASEEGSFLTLGGRGRGGSPSSYVALAHAVAIGKRFLSKGDALFLDRVVGGDVPTWDWKKLNRKATFKMSYKQRSGQILETLKKLKVTFEANLDEMKEKEAATVETYNTLMASKQSQKESAEEALSKMELEGAARGQTKSEAEAEIADLTTQMEADAKFIEQAKSDLAVKDGEWTDRQKVRQDEIQAISEALAVLSSDEARDTFKRSLKSQGYSLLQVARGSASAGAARAGRELGALRALRRAASASGDARVARLMEEVAAGPAPAPAAPAEHFKQVIAAIDNILALLEEEEASDLSTKEACETSRAESTRNAVLKAREVDDMSDALARLQSEIAEIDTQLGEKAEEVSHIEEEMTSAQRLRDDEHSLWVQSDADDVAAAGLLEQARTVLEAFYKAQGALFVQGGKRQPSYYNDFVSASGEAPPPPPKTWEDPYAGRQDESKGIFTILTLLIEDIEADRLKAKAAEGEAAGAHTKFVDESNKQLETIRSGITQLESSKADKVLEAETTTGERATAKEELASIMLTIQDSQPGCDFQLVNFATRKAKRAVEKDGLLEAKAVLMGASFN